MARALSVGATSASFRKTAAGRGAAGCAARSASASACLPNGSRAARLPEVYLSQVSFCWAVSSRSSRTSAASASSGASPSAGCGCSEQLVEAVGLLEQRDARVTGRLRADLRAAGRGRAARAPSRDAVDQLLHLLVDLGEQRLGTPRSSASPPKASASKNPAAAHPERAVGRGRPAATRSPRPPPCIWRKRLARSRRRAGPSSSPCWYCARWCASALASTASSMAARRLRRRRQRDGEVGMEEVALGRVRRPRARG